MVLSMLSTPSYFLNKSKKFNTLMTAVKAAGLVETLSSPCPFTVFAPTDAVFGKLPAETVKVLFSPKLPFSEIETLAAP